MNLVHINKHILQCCQLGHAEQWCCLLLLEFILLCDISYSGTWMRYFCFCCGESENPLKLAYRLYIYLIEMELLNYKYHIIIVT